MANTRKKHGTGGKDKPTSIGAINDLLARQRAYYDKHLTKPLSWRLKVVNRLGALIQGNGDDLAKAVADDLHISAYEAYLTEVAPLLDELSVIQAKLKDWTGTEQEKSPSKLKPLKFSTYWQPLGCACLINDWRSPVYATLLPAIYALSAGCTATIKTSERAEASNKVLGEMIEELFIPDYVTMLTGDEELDGLLAGALYDKLYYEGPSSSATMLREAVAKTGASLTMTLDGNCPCFVDGSFDLAASAERIMWGKMLRSGQGRLAPSWVLCHEDSYKSFINRSYEYVKRTYGDKPLTAEGYPRMFSRKEYDRACEYLEHAGKRGQVIYGGDRDPNALAIAPTVVLLDKFDGEFLRRRVLGPTLPVVTYSMAEEALNNLAKTGTPPAFYVFSENSAAVNYALNYVSFGTGALRDTMIQTADRQMPAASLGSCGIGQLGGLDGLQEFGVRKTVAESGSKRALDWRFPPYPASTDALKKLYHFKPRAER